jgi:multidrug efflux pump subunit AcrA (membrane-fusion protein)
LAAVVPRLALQHVGDRQFVSVVNRAGPGTFTQREVQVGDASREQVEIVSGVEPGDRIVSKGKRSLFGRNVNGSDCVPVIKRAASRELLAWGR